ncbi:MAG: hypothetical protein BGO41_00455 [Clostridiales bacterium 38-18]|nr:MAG: hypothetical protein BGO41_00455 [Clostridiales bacterium 38-18]
MTNIKFEGILYEINRWLILKLPRNISEQLPTRGLVLATGTLNQASINFPFEPDGNGGHFYKLDDTNLDMKTLKAGDHVTVVFSLSKDGFEPPLPKDVETMLLNEGLMAFWETLTVKARWEWIRWIRSTNNPETRKKRIGVAYSKMNHGSRRPCCFNTNQCTDTSVAKTGVLDLPKIEISSVL